eukprot:TRINITY_DN50395_c0_g1_i1.p2 TRINITY_DN50395_c0_g1~~TRINITY_DN50395_c0_g1_i1.p2  ORF type:complete len:135 (+),score=25.58 TRINITY_DN50395_c0_g1_i1:74-478(+)
MAPKERLVPTISVPVDCIAAGQVLWRLRVHVPAGAAVLELKAAIRTRVRYLGFRADLLRLEAKGTAGAALGDDIPAAEAARTGVVATLASEPTTLTASEYAAQLAWVAEDLAAQRHPGGGALLRPSSAPQSAPG